jgi:release factor glutamine methyltransferase
LAFDGCRARSIGAKAETVTYDDLIAGAAERLSKSEIDAPRREARLLMALAADLSTAALIAHSKDQVPGPVAARFEEMVHRREGREPFAHIAGYRSFYGMEFISDARALVPRPESEVVVEAALKLMRRGREVRIADLGTGSGCLLAAILQTRAGVTGVGVEASAVAASLARENIKRHGLEARVEIAVSDWSDWTGWGEVDLVVSNPPYIASGVIEGLDPEVRLHDPVAALDGGIDGLEAYRGLTAMAGQRMQIGAWLVLEIGFDQREAVIDLLEASGFDEISSAKDLGGHDRVVWGHKPGVK